MVVLAAGPVELQERQDSIKNSSWVKDGSSLTKTHDMSEVQVDILNLFHVASAQLPISRFQKSIGPTKNLERLYNREVVADLQIYQFLTVQQESGEAL